MDKYRLEVQGLIEQLTIEKQFVFAILCCERLFENYVVFSSKYKWGNVGDLKISIDTLVKYIENKYFDKDEILFLIRKIDKATPNTEDFNSILVSFALDACNSIYEALEFILDPQIEKIVDIATFARDTVDMYIQEKNHLAFNDPFFEFKIENDYYMVQEKALQKGQLNFLLLNDLNTYTFKKLRSENLNNQIIDTSIFKYELKD
jgi:uncharacterized protein